MIKVKQITLFIDQSTFCFIDEYKYGELASLLYEGFQLVYPQPTKIVVRVLNERAQTQTKIELDGDYSIGEQRELVLIVEKLKRHIIDLFMRGVRV